MQSDTRKRIQFVTMSMRPATTDLIWTGACHGKNQPTFTYVHTYGDSALSCALCNFISSTVGLVGSNSKFIRLRDITIERKKVKHGKAKYSVSILNSNLQSNF